MNDGLSSGLGPGLDNDDENFIAGDVFGNGMGSMMAMVAILLLIIGLKSDNADVAAPPGNVSIEMVWPANTKDGRCFHADVDLWVLGPEGYPVGYSRQSGKIYNLVRDDLGCYQVGDMANIETAFSRGLYPGKHCVNTHLFGNVIDIYPVPVHVTVRVFKAVVGTHGSGAKPQVLSQDVQLTHKGEEINVFCFYLDKKGDIEYKKTFDSPSVRLRAMRKDAPTQSPGQP